MEDNFFDEDVDKLGERRSKWKKVEGIQRGILVKELLKRDEIALAAIQARRDAEDKTSWQ